MGLPLAGVSILAIDPGGTTGVCVYDAWDQKTYVDQLDAGHGRKSKYKVHGGVVESGHREDVKKYLTSKYGVQTKPSGAETEAEIADVCERGVCNTLLNIAIALGPKSIIVIEDFVLGHGQDANLSAGRKTLAPVRIASRLEQVLWDNGVLNGDAWRIWQDHGWGGRDMRGWSIDEAKIPDFRNRLTKVEKWRLSSQEEQEGIAWSGEGSRFFRQMPSVRCFVKGGIRNTEKWLRENNFWVKGLPHGMDALMHAMVVARKIGATVPELPERIFPGNAKPHKGGITAKTTKSGG